MLTSSKLSSSRCCLGRPCLRLDLLYPAVWLRAPMRQTKLASLYVCFSRAKDKVV